MSSIIDFIYPPRCPVCDNILKEGKNVPCIRCAHFIRYIQAPGCLKCGKQLEENEKEYCYDCMKTQHFFDRGVAVWSYQDEIKQSIYNFKYYNKRENAIFYGNEMVRIYGRTMIKWNADVIIPIPLHSKRLRKRGYNQAELIANVISPQIGIPVNNKIIRRTINTKPQKELKTKERIKNLKEAFTMDSEFPKVKKAILIDDIYTTGATIDACARLLKENGFQEVYFACICTGKGY